MAKYINQEDLDKYKNLHSKFNDRARALVDELKQQLESGELMESQQKVLFKDGLLELGKEFDHRLLINHGLEADNVDRQPFIILVKEILMKNKIPVTKEDLGNAPKKDEIKLIESKSVPKDVYTDRGFNMLHGNQEVVIEGDLNYKVKWVHDVITETLWQHIQEQGIEKQRKPLMDIKNADDLINKVSQLKVGEDLPILTFTDSDFRKITGRDRLTGEQILELVRKYSKITVDGILATFWSTERKKYETVGVAGTMFEVIWKESGEVSNRNKKPIWKYTVLMHVWGFMLYNNLLQHKFTGFDRGFYKLKGSQQELVRLLSQFNNSSYKFSTVLKILGMKEDAKNPRRQMQLVVKHLKETEKKGYINNWRLTKMDDKEPVFHFKGN